MKAVVAAFNQEKALVGAFSVITNLRMELFESLLGTAAQRCPALPSGLYNYHQSPPPAPRNTSHHPTIFIMQRGFIINYYYTIKTWTVLDTLPVDIQD